MIFIDMHQNFTVFCADFRLMYGHKIRNSGKKTCKTLTQKKVSNNRASYDAKTNTTVKSFIVQDHGRLFGC